MIDCSNTTALFELGFGLSAVLAVVGETTAKARARFVMRIASAVRSKVPTLREESLVGEKFEELALSGFPKLELLFRFSVNVRLYAALMLVVSLGTLIQTALWGSSCKMLEIDLYRYVFFAYLLGPFIYWAYARYLEYVIDSAIAKRVPEMAARLLAPITSSNEAADDLLASVQSVIKGAQHVIDREASQREQSGRSEGA